MIRYHIELTAKDGSNIRRTMDAKDLQGLEKEVSSLYPEHELKVRDQVKI